MAATPLSCQYTQFSNPSNRSFIPWLPSVATAAAENKERKQPDLLALLRRY